MRPLGLIRLIVWLKEFALSKLIEPRTLKGFRDYMPELMIPREKILEIARQVYRSYGFAPIDTPALEYAEVLLGKGGEESDKIVYRFKDHGDRDVALRFDLTVPFARFSAQYVNQLGIPFKRYAMGPVWRGENTGQGRYREFWQCDFDTIGTTSNASDIETALVINDLFQAIGFTQFEVRINNRMVLNGRLESLGLGDKSVPLLRSLDKLLKIGVDKVCEEMVQEAGVTPEQARKVVALADIKGTNEEILNQVERDCGSNPKTQEGIRRLRELLSVAKTTGVPEGRFRIDLSICRGLDYYTGTIYETFLLSTYTEEGKEKKLEGFGSVCSGGRYDNLAGKYTKQSLPGVGASLGVDRLLAAMEAANLLPKVSTPAPVLIVQFTADRLGDYQRIGNVLRLSGIGAEVYPDAKKVGPQLQYAEKKGFRFALIAGPEEFTNRVWKVKDLTKREEQTVGESELVNLIQQMLK
jgi:histidyl-tRNA synthetase